MTRMKYRLDIRISPQDRAILRRQSRKFGMSQADYLRMMINLPTEAIERGRQADVLVVDRWGVIPLARQVRHLGYLYNQAVHALNQLAKYARQNELDEHDVTEVGERVFNQLQLVGRKTYEIEDRLAELVNPAFGIEFFTPSSYPSPLFVQAESAAELKALHAKHGKVHIDERLEEEPY